MIHRSVRPDSREEANYIVYLLDGDGHIRGAEWIAAASDADALRQVSALDHPFELELWQGSRKVPLSRASR